MFYVVNPCQPLAIAVSAWDHEFLPHNSANIKIGNIDEEFTTWYCVKLFCVGKCLHWSTVCLEIK